MCNSRYEYSSACTTACGDFGFNDMQNIPNSNYADYILKIGYGLIPQVPELGKYSFFFGVMCVILGMNIVLPALLPVVILASMICWCN